MSAVASMFLKLTTNPGEDGEARFRGEAKDAEYRDQIEINDWKWNLDRPSEPSSPAGSGANSVRSSNAVEPSVLSFSKPMCRATSGMLSAMRSGEFIHAVFSLEEDSEVDFLLTLTLFKVRILSYSVGIKGKEISEKWSFNYSEIEFLYRNNYADFSGDLKLNLFRSADASTDSPAAGEDKILALAEKMSADALGPLAQKLIEMSMKKSSVHNKTEAVTKVGRG